MFQKFSSFPFNRSFEINPLRFGLFFCSILIKRTYQDKFVYENETILIRTIGFFCGKFLLFLLLLLLREIVSFRNNNAQKYLIFFFPFGWITPTEDQLFPANHIFFFIFKILWIVVSNRTALIKLNIYIFEPEK